MFEYLNNIDQTIFLFINVKLANPVTDYIMPYITADIGLKVLYGLAMVTVLIKGNAKLRWLVLFSFVTLLLTDQISANYLKHLIERPRPCHFFDPESINLLVGCGGGYSMPSAHAANAFGQAVLFSFQYRRVSWYLFSYATVVAFSRVFVGVHYPGDIFVGALIGLLIGLTLSLSFMIIFRSRLKNKNKQ